jgi:hypothetical protein
VRDRRNRVAQGKRTIDAIRRPSEAMQKTHRATTLLDEPPLKNHNEIDGHTGAAVDPDAEFHRRETRETDCRRWDCEQSDLGQFGNTDILCDRAILRGNVNCGALASRRTTLRTLLAADTSVRATASRSLRATTAGLSVFNFRGSTAGRRSTFRHVSRCLRLVQPGTKQMDFPVGTTARLVRHPAPQCERHHCQDHELPKEKHFGSSAVYQYG